VERWKVLQSETGSLSGGDYHWFKRSTREKRLMTRNNDNNIIIIIIITPYSKYRCCIQFDETMEHIIYISASQLAKEQYIRDMTECMLNYTLTYARKEG